MTDRTVADVLRRRRRELTPAELRVAQALLGDYPAAGLQPIVRLAEVANVSPPTVLRLVTKLGYGGYPQIQEVLRAELSARTAGPLEDYPSEGEPLAVRARSFGAALTESLRAQDQSELAAAADLLADRERRILITGGRFSWTLAAHLATFAGLLRPQVSHVPNDPGARAAALLDVDETTVVVAFDYRRYQRDTVTFGRAAAGQGASLVVCTDPYLSPLASSATVLLTTTVEGPPPFVTLVPAFALVETLVLGVVERGGKESQHRVAAFERLNADVVDGGPAPLSSSP
ncbi:transcriptional repressor QapR [Actinoallomurus bryophytorum]|uniref:RpiR family transcriptional regulator n=1 Tax=Actinoallomurus bryophytorum TaxID=1490222 RepID=A0A543CLK2_9ACTN|nr:MurR/RpiR family transcriptional regulator [Actinoallomurus bryophytorum]TQL97979.1 RpiR family transcriptional regulator [Actinoallomurus bryophytorum]